MSKRVPLWPAAVLPAALIGHAGAYALDGRTIADGHHAWVAPVFELSCAALLLTAIFLIGSALSQARDFVRSPAQFSLWSLWPRMATAQVLLFVAMERTEGVHVTIAGIVMQLAVALCAAYLLTLFTRLIARCVAFALEASTYVERRFAASIPFEDLPWAPHRAALLAAAGSNRFQRPPPLT